MSDKKPLNPRIITISEAMVKGVELEVAKDATTASTTNVDKDPNAIYYGCLDGNLTKDIVTEVNDYNKDFCAAANVAAKTIIAPAFGKHKTLQDVEMTIGMGGRSSVTIGVKREDSFVNPKDPENKIVKIGAAKMVISSAINPKSVSMKALREEISEAVANAISKKK